MLAALAVAGCGTFSPKEAPPPPAAAPGKGAYYKDDGPGASLPADLAAIPDAVPRAEPLHRFANRPYQVFGKDYVPVLSVAQYRQTGIGSWYGRRYHGAPTSSGEPYDMYAMTAAHPTLPIPSYVRVTNLANGRSVVVRINDRGPFHSDRIIDLSYTAAWKLGYVEAGSARLEVEGIVPGSAPAAVMPVRQEREPAEEIQVVAAGPVFRLHLGPYRSQDQARPIADRIQSELSLRPLLVTK